MTRSTPPAARKCSICNGEFSEFNGSEHYPFCSLRCKNVDLWRWFSESYSIQRKNSEKGSGQPVEFKLYDYE